MDRSDAALPTVEPLPPVAALSMPWDEPMVDPVDDFALARATHGDTFVVDSGRDRYLFVFDPIGVQAFYALDEAVASKGIADWRMLSRKVPAELFLGRRTLPHDLFSRSEVEQQVRNLAAVLAEEIALLAESAARHGAVELDVFAWTRRVGHLVGLTSWGGRAMADAARTTDLLADLDGLDAADAFVRPEAMARIEAAGHADERASLERIVAVMAPLIEAHEPTDDLLTTIIDTWADVDGAPRTTGIAHDVVLVHLASMSNLFAALGWTLVDVVGDDARLAAARAGDDGAIDRCTLESIRLAQRSVMLRHVLVDTEIATDLGPLAVARGATIATLLPLTNDSSGPGLDTYDPDRWAGRRLVRPDGLAAKELVTTFGHGRHTCPAQGFSMQAIRAVVAAVVTAFDVDRLGPPPRPRRGQIGGVARSEDACLLRLTSRRP